MHNWHCKWHCLIVNYAQIGLASILVGLPKPHLDLPQLGLRGLLYFKIIPAQPVLKSWYSPIWVIKFLPPTPTPIHPT